MMSKAEMASKTIDDQFNRALEIVNNARGEQHIQLDYTQKLALYSYVASFCIPVFFFLCCSWLSLAVTISKVLCRHDEVRI